LALTIEATLAKCINDTKKVPKKAFLKK